MLLHPRVRTARLVLLIASVLCCACGLLATAAPPAHALDATALRATLSREMLRGGFPFAGAYVRDLDTGTALYAHKEDVARPPASVEKLYTTSTTLLRFGAATRFHTQVVATGALDSQGVWRGDLYLRGAGDPTLGQAQIVTLAQTIAAQSGIHRVAGSVLGDESVFDSLRGSSRTGYAVDRDIVGVLSGVAVARGFSRDGSPPTEAARRLAKALRAAGVAVDGASGAGTAPAEAPEVAGIDSPPVGDLIRFTNVPSDNFDAEMLLKRLGASFGGAGTTQAGVAVVRSQLATFGVHPRIVDGSGLSRADRTTPRQVVRLLERMSGTEVAHDVPGVAAGRRTDRDDAPPDARHGRAGPLPDEDRDAARGQRARRLLPDDRRPQRRVRDAHVDPVHHPRAPRPGPDDRGDRHLRELGFLVGDHWAGKSTRISAPPSADSPTAISASCRRACWATSARPSPEPRRSAAASPSTRWNGSKIRSRSASGMPGPSSSTSSRRPAPVHRRASVTRTWPSARPWRTAFSTRLSTSIRRPGSQPRDRRPAPRAARR